MTPSARLAAVAELLDTIFGSSGRAEQAVSSYFRSRRYAGSKDRRWISEFLYRTLRHLGDVDWALAQIALDSSNRRRAIVAALVLDEQALPEFAETCFQGAHALKELSEVELEALAQLPNLDKAARPAHVTGNFPEWLAALLQDQYGGKADAIMATYAMRAPLTFRVNRLKADRDAVLEQLQSEDIPARATDLSPVGIVIGENRNLNAHELVKSGVLEIQDEAAQVAALLAQAAPGMQVMDYCAGGGGKTLAMGADMENSGRIIALDIDARRMRDVASRCKRADLTIAETRVFPADDEESAFLDALRAKMDCVFVDAPCSGSGAWRRQPEQKWHLTAERLAELTALQADILQEASTYVAPGGRLIYATCSILEQENSAQVDHFLAQNPDFQVTEFAPIWTEAEIGKEPTGKFLELTPELYGTDGFFAGVLTRS